MLVENFHVLFYAYDYRAILSRREIYDQSLKELQLTVDELERRSAGIGEESKTEVTSCCFRLQIHVHVCDIIRAFLLPGNEWKTRYETQVEMNQQLEKQAILLQDKIVDARSTLKDSEHDKVEYRWLQIYM